MVRNGVKRLLRLPDCKDTSVLLSARQDRSLSLRERVELYVHLVACEGCRQFERQLAFMRTAFKRYLERDEEPKH